MEESRRILESHLNEFFALTTSNERKRQIESVLDNFSRQPGSWKQALYFLSHSNGNQYVGMFCLSVIENTIKYKWVSMSQTEQLEVRSTIYSYLIQNASSTDQCPHFVRNKMIKVLTDIGKFSWPQDYPDFLSNILQITANSETSVIGLLFLKTLSEEWPACKDEVSSDRKQNLKLLFVKELGKIFQLFYQILNTGFNQETGNLSFASDCPLAGVVALTLETITHYFSWIPLDGLLLFSGSASFAVDASESKSPFPAEFIHLICQYAMIDASSSTPSKVQSGGCTFSILALSAINELLYRKYVPKDFDAHINVLSYFGIEVLSKILQSSDIKSIPELYIEKVVEFLCLMASSHFFRFEAESAKSLMSLLLQFTFSQKDGSFYYECLEIWSRILDHLNAQLPFINKEDAAETLESFKEPVLLLASGIVKSTAKFSATKVDDCFDVEDEEDIETSNITRNIDILVKIGELLPLESLQAVTTTWNECCKFYMELQSCLDQTKTVLNVEKLTTVEHFNFIVQLVGRMANIFYDGDVFKQELELGKTLISQLVWLYSYSQTFYFVRRPAIIIQGNCEIVYSLKTWLYWLARYHSEVILVEPTAEEEKIFVDLLKSITEMVFSTINHCCAIEPTIVLANLNLFCTLTNSIRSKHLFNLCSFPSLVHKCEELRTSLDSECYRLLNKAIASLLLLPWQNSSEQDWESRNNLFSLYMGNLLSQLYQSVTRPTQLVEYIRVLNDQLDLLKVESSVSKKMSWSILKDAVPFLQNILSTYLRQPAVSEEVMTFFLKIMEVLRQQSGAPFFENSIKGFLNLFSSQNLITDLLKETESSSIVIEKFLQMLQFMVKDPSPSLKKFLPDSLAVCFDHIYPILAQRSSPDLKIPFFQFVRDCLNYRWNYFFPTLVVSLPKSKPLPGANHVDETSLSKASNRLDQVLESIGHSFLQPDLEVFRFNLNSFSQWNEKHNMYMKLSAKPQALNQFMTVLIQVLVRKTHDLLREEVAFVLFEMAAVNYSRFCDEFLPELLFSHFPRLNPVQRNSILEKFRKMDNPQDYDLHTFSQNLGGFIDDLRFCHFYIECQQRSSSSSNA